MAKSATSVAPKRETPEEHKLPRFRVTLKGYPVTGFVERVDGIPKVHSTLPAEPHYRPKDVQAAADEGLADRWYSQRELSELYGQDDPPKGWRRRTRVRMDLASVLFRGAVVAAPSDAQARDEFCERYGVTDAIRKNFTVTPAKPGDEIGPFDPKKDRGLLARAS